MKKTLLLLIVLAASAWSQTAPNAYTTNYRIRQWASGANPSADSLNANWALIDSTIRRPRYTYQDSVIVGASAAWFDADIYAGGNSGVGATLLMGIPNSTYGVVRYYGGGSANYAHVQRDTSYSADPKFIWPVLAAGNYRIATINGNQNFTDIGNLTGEYIRANDSVVVGTGTTGAAGILKIFDNSQDSYGWRIYGENAGAVFNVVLPSKSGTLPVNVVADTAAFSGTATRLAVYVAGATSADVYTVSPRIVAGLGGETLPTSNDVLGAAAKTDSLIVLRPASGTSGLKIQYIRKY